MELTFNIPDTNLHKEEVQLLLAIKLFEENIISLGKTAEIAQFSEKAFVEILTHKGVSAISYSNMDLQKELDNA